MKIAGMQLHCRMKAEVRRCAGCCPGGEHAELVCTFKCTNECLHEPSTSHSRSLEERGNDVHRFNDGNFGAPRLRWYHQKFHWNKSSSTHTLSGKYTLRTGPAGKLTKVMETIHNPTHRTRDKDVVLEPRKCSDTKYATSLAQDIISVYVVFSMRLDSPRVRFSSSCCKMMTSNAPFLKPIPWLLRAAPNPWIIIA